MSVCMEVGRYVAGMEVPVARRDGTSGVVVVFNSVLFETPAGLDPASQ